MWGGAESNAAEKQPSWGRRWREETAASLPHSITHWHVFVFCRTWEPNAGIQRMSSDPIKTLMRLIYMFVSRCLQHLLSQLFVCEPKTRERRAGRSGEAPPVWGQIAKLRGELLLQADGLWRVGTFLQGAATEAFCLGSNTKHTLGLSPKHDFMDHRSQSCLARSWGNVWRALPIDRTLISLFSGLLLMSESLYITGSLEPLWPLRRVLGRNVSHSEWNEITAPVCAHH